MEERIQIEPVYLCFLISDEPVKLCIFAIVHTRCKCGLQDSFCHILQCLRRCTASELGNRCPISKFFIRGKSGIRRDQRNKLMVEVLERDILTGNLTPGGTCEPTLYLDGLPMTWLSPRQEVLIACIHKLCACALLI
ncbi:hypothetical protein AVEN_186677-1 [Araneus ventricosus]|uniref:Uncharacterized protein n=1 Tax=Araneus ventricosus TaxID=182803 RepID=A0A4Y2G886_ARAVE|nr:hypothetical protein AVEN_186677-1 [Araneus ventricosus]